MDAPPPPNGPFRGFVLAVAIEVAFIIIFGLIVWAVFAS